MAKTKIELKNANELGVILEDMNSKFDILIEGHKTLNEKVDKLDSRIERMENRIDNLENRIDKFKAEIESNFKTIFECLSNIDNFNIKTDENFKTVFEYLLNIKSEIVEIKKKLANKTDINRVVILEKRVNKIEMELSRIRTA